LRKRLLAFSGMLFASGLASPLPADADGPMLVTGYSLPGVTASGVPVGPGVAACPRWLDLGAKLEIDGIGEVVCADRYPAGYGDHIDVWVPSTAQARALTGWYTFTREE
jgi:3D (Asp-Asp-Asp) domain-containing protein